jgi:hypothetical protein
MMSPLGFGSPAGMMSPGFGSPFMFGGSPGMLGGSLPLY